jgi:hypothetical protein
MQGLGRLDDGLAGRFGVMDVAQGLDVGTVVGRATQALGSLQDGPFGRLDVPSTDGRPVVPIGDPMPRKPKPAPVDPVPGLRA